MGFFWLSSMNHHLPLTNIACSFDTTRFPKDIMIIMFSIRNDIFFFICIVLQAVLWILLAIFSLIRLQADYLLVVGVCLTLSIANIVGFTKCKKGQ